MQDFLRSAKHTAFTTGHLVWNNLFRVLALFTLAMLIFLSAHYTWVVLSPADNYLKYHDLSVADVTQGERAVATVCYEVNERHQADGEAVFYVENQKGERVYDSKVEFDFTLSGGSPCEQEYIPTQKLEPGTYYLHLIRTIRVQTLVPFTDPIEKKADVAAVDSFKVTEKRLSEAEVREIIAEINKRIDELNRKLREQNQEPVIVPSPQSTSRSNQPSTSGSPEPRSRPNPPRPSQPTPPQRPVEPRQPTLIENLIAPVRGLLGGN